MKQKIVFFDIDGTLITEDGNQTLPESTVYAIQELRRRGHLAFINSGRTLFNVIEQPYILRIGLMAMYAPAVLISYTVANTFLLLQFLMRRMLLLLMQPAVIIWSFCLRDQIIFILICPYL